MGQSCILKSIQFTYVREIVYKETEQATKGTSVYYKASGTIEEQLMVFHRENAINKEIQDKRQTEEFVHHLKDWADAKERLESEITRKIGQSYAGSKYEQRAFRINVKAEDQYLEVTNT